MAKERKHQRKTKLRYFRDGDFSPRALIHAAADLFYFTGCETEYFFHVLGRGILSALRRMGSGALWTLSLLEVVFRPLWHTVHEDLAAPWRQLRQGLANLLTMLRQEREAGSAGLAKKGGRYLLRGIYLYRGLLWRGLSYLLPVGAAAVLALTVSSVINSNFALRVEYRGEVIGFIENETVFDSAQEIISQRIQGGHDVSEWADRPVMTLAVVDRAAVSTQSQLADTIVSMSSEKFQQATGVLVNGVLVGATTDAEELNEAYAQPLEALNPENAPNVTASYRQDVELQPGLYFTDTLVSGRVLVDRLTGAKPITLPSGEQLNWNVLAETQVTVRSTYTEEYAAEAQEIENSGLDWGTERVLQEARAGTREVTADLVYVDGNLIQRNVLETTVLQEAVPEIVEYGTYNRYGTSGAPGDGDFIWPVPGFRGQSRGFIRYGSYVSHRGLDITAKSGTPIVAADSGVVTFAGLGRGYNWSYGNFVKIDHGNGYTSLYGHMLAVAVSEGDYVSKGDVIGYVGSTGRSTGNHCHFEITRDGVLQDPADYVAMPQH